MKGSTGKNISRRLVLGGLLAGVGQAAIAESLQRSLRPVARAKGFQVLSAPGAEELVAKANLSGKIGFVVSNARTGQILESMNPVLGLPPASVAKAITAQYALETLGPAHAFSTRIMATAPLLNGKVDGDLVLIGGGDPTLDTNGLAEMASALKSTGLREVTGRFLVHGGDLPHVDRIDAGQPDHLGYNPAISGLNLNYNRVHFEWKRSSNSFSVTMDARSDKYRPEVALQKMRIVDRKSPIYTYTNGDSEQWTVAKAALGKGGSRWLPVRKPEHYAGEVLQILVRSHGIVLRKPEIADGAVRGTVLVERKSPPLQSILKGMLAYSTNLTAEVSGLSASIERGRDVQNLSASGAEMSKWMRERLGARRPRFVDHSGLSDATRITATDMVEALVRLGPDSTLASIMKPIPMRNGNGDLRKSGDVKLRAKTGTLNFTSGLAGFMSAGKNTELAFAIFSADIARRETIPVANRERPPGAKGWSNVARRLQWGLLDRWADLYGT